MYPTPYDNYPGTGLQPYQDYQEQYPYSLQQPWQPSNSQALPEPSDDYLSIAALFSARFTTALCLTLLVRLIPALQSFYWILVIVAIAGCAMAIRFQRNFNVLSLLLVVVAATLAGHWDFFAYMASQAMGGK